jgi:hypothetical protein
MAWGRGLLRLWAVGWGFWTIFWLEQYVCYRADRVFEIDCSVQTNWVGFLLAFVIWPLLALLAGASLIWITRGFIAKVRDEASGRADRRARLKQIGIKQA